MPSSHAQSSSVFRSDEGQRSRRPARRRALYLARRQAGLFKTNDGTRWPLARSETPHRFRDVFLFRRHRDRVASIALQARAFTHVSIGGTLSLYQYKNHNSSHILHNGPQGFHSIPCQCVEMVVFERKKDPKQNRR